LVDRADRTETTRVEEKKYSKHLIFPQLAHTLDNNHVHNFVKKHCPHELIFPAAYERPHLHDFDKKQHVVASQ